MHLPTSPRRKPCEHAHRVCPDCPHVVSLAPHATHSCHTSKCCHSQYCCHSIVAVCHSVVVAVLSQCCCCSVVATVLLLQCCHSVVVAVPQLPEVSWETASVRMTPQDTPRTPPRQQVRNLVYTDTCLNSRSLRRLLTYLLGTACTQTPPSACTPQLGTASGYLPR